ncbi:MAG: riboflavin synthase [Gemmataceae bacterium]
MFTGLVEALGTVRELVRLGEGCRLVVEAPSIAEGLSLGESVAVNGTCLSVVEYTASTFAFDVGPETLLRTNLGSLVAQDRVNLERSLRFSDRLGGHLVQGHVDGVGTIDDRIEQGEWVTVWFRCSRELAGQMVSKGSVAVDGISLTLVDVEPERFSVALIPHTLQVTTLGFKGVGAAVNLETDLLAKYVWKYLQLRQS